MSETGQAFCPLCCRPIVTEDPNDDLACMCFRMNSKAFRDEIRRNLANCGNGVIEDAGLVIDWLERQRHLEAHRVAADIEDARSHAREWEEQANHWKKLYEESKR